jgi:hypothetical protein
MDARIEMKLNRPSKGTHDRGREIYQRGRCLVENPARHF